MTFFLWKYYILVTECSHPSLNPQILSYVFLRFRFCISLITWRRFPPESIPPLLRSAAASPKMLKNSQQYMHSPRRKGDLFWVSSYGGGRRERIGRKYAEAEYRVLTNSLSRKLRRQECKCNIQTMGKRNEIKRQILKIKSSRAHRKER